MEAVAHALPRAAELPESEWTMTDTYWEQLLRGVSELSAIPKDQPPHAHPDAELGVMLSVVTPEEAAYEAPAVASVRDVDVQHDGGSFAIRIYTSTRASSGRPLLVWCHGGAWAAGDLDGPEGDATAREVAVRADAVVVSVDYRLASHGVHFPAPLDDVVAAYLWARDHAEELGADPERITLAGASAGGNLAAGATLWLRDHHLPMPASLALAYATVHPEMPAPSAELASKLTRLSQVAGAVSEIYRPMVENYFGGPMSVVSPYAMPGVSPDLTGFPPTYVFNDEFDGLRASGEKFAVQLAAAGAYVLLETLPGVDHGHFARPGLSQSRRSHRDLAAWVDRRAVPESAVVVDADAALGG